MFHMKRRKTSRLFCSALQTFRQACVEECGHAAHTRTGGYSTAATDVSFDVPKQNSERVPRPDLFAVGECSYPLKPEPAGHPTYHDRQVHTFAKATHQPPPYSPLRSAMFCIKNFFYSNRQQSTGQAQHLRFVLQGGKNSYGKYHGKSIKFLQ